jgi:ribosomal protein S18 acetylase RimI-like enzyme
MSEVPNLLVRVARRDDADQIAAVHVAAWRAAYAHVYPQEFLASDEFAERRHERWREWRLGAGERVAVATLPADHPSSDAPTGPPTRPPNTERVVAFAWYGPERDRGRGQTGRGEITAFYTDPRAWGSGVANVLMEFTELRLRAEGFVTAVLWVLTDNPRARRFYERHGWAPTGIEGEFEIAGTSAPEVEYRKELS